MKLGALTINDINGGNTHIDGGAIFGVVPKPLWTRKYGVNDKNQVHTPTHPILIQHPQYNILIDAGVGNGKLTDKQKRNYGVTQEGFIKEELQYFGLTPDDIDIVLMTHLHYDHAAGLTDSNGNALFKNATHYIQQDEWHEFLAPNLRSKATYWEKNQGDYQENIILFDKEIEPVSGIKMIHTGGHSFGHSLVTIESEGEKAVHMADIFPTVAHQNPLWVTAYDDYPMTSIREKERLIPYYVLNDYWFLYYHDENYFAVKYNHKDHSITSSIKRSYRQY